MELLSFRRILSILDIDADIWTKYYSVEVDEDYNNQLFEIIDRTIQNKMGIGSIEEIWQIEKRSGFDGIYYRVIFITSEQIQYQAIFFWIPETDYLETLKLEAIISEYNAESEKVLPSIPQGDKFFNLCQQYLSSNYGSVVSNSQLEFVAFYESQQIRFYRFVYISLSGKNEIILQFETQTSSISTLRWERLEDGYVHLDLSKVSSDEFYLKAASVAKNYCSSNLKINSNPSSVEFKTVTGYRYFKLLYTQPFPFMLVVDSRDSQSFTVRGIERIQIAPTSEYYNDRLFAGYQSISINELEEDIVYQYFLFALSESEYSKTVSIDSEVVAAFKLVNPLGSYFKVIYRVPVTLKLYVITYFYDFLQGEYLVLES